nr:hypothetical protein [Tanacetum cinerariifolium]
MIAILEKYEHYQDFHQIVDFVEASHIRYALTFNPTVYVSHIRQFWSTARIETTKEGTKILATVDGEGSGTPTEPHHTPTPEATPSPQHELSSSSLSPVTTEPLPTVIPFDNPPLRDDSQGEACPIDSGLEAKQDRENITKTSTLPSNSTPRVASLAADEGNMQHKLTELTDLCTRLQRQQADMALKINAQELEISQLKARVRLLEDREGGGSAQSGEDAPIKGRSLDEREATAIERSTERGSEFANATVSIPTGSGSIPTASSPGTGVPTGSGMVLTSSLIFTTAIESIPYTRRKGKEKMVESDTPKKKKLQEQIDV